MDLRRIAVLGSNSFSGSDFVDLLLEKENIDVLGISRAPEKSEIYLPYLKRNLDRYRFCQLDLNHNLSDIQGLLDNFKPDAIVNFACQSEVAPSWRTPEDWFQTNCVAFSRLLNHLKNKTYLKRYLHIGTPEVYGTTGTLIDETAPAHPSTPYAVSRAAQDDMLRIFLQRYEFPWVMVRSANVYGPHQQLWKIIPRSFLYLESSRKIELHGGGLSRRSFIHIRDVSHGEFLALREGAPGDIFHLSTDETVEIRELVQRICQMAGKSFEASTIRDAERPGQDLAYLLDTKRAQEKLKWTPRITLNEGLAQVRDWVTENTQRLLQEPLEYDHRR